MWQKCPICNGTGKTGEKLGYYSVEPNCSVCQGTKIISEVNGTNKMTDRELALFLRWLIKHYSTEIVYNGMFTYVDSLGREVDIKNIIDHYKSEQ